jgi:hypothetical protein
MSKKIIMIECKKICKRYVKLYEKLDRYEELDKFKILKKV